VYGNQSNKIIIVNMKLILISHQEQRQNINGTLNGPLIQIMYQNLIIIK